MFYAYELKKLGLPTDKLSVNGDILSNKYQRLEYLNSLETDEDKAQFITYLIDSSYQLGYDQAINQDH